MIVTMEPGIYIPTGSPCDKKYWGIGIRIEDDVVVTETGCLNLSEHIPHHPDEIEAWMASLK